MGERGKINWPEHTAGGSQNKGTEKLREELARPRWRKEAGGGERGKLSPRDATPSHTANRPRFLSKDFLRPEAHWGRGGKRRAAPGESAPKPLAARAARCGGKRLTAPRRTRASLWLPEPLTAEGKGAPQPERGRPSLWLPGPLAAERKGALHPGRGRPSLWLPEPLRPGKTQNAGATESALLWRTRKLEPHSMQGPLHIEQPGA